MNNIRPPWIAKKLIEFFADTEEKITISGDIEEYFCEIAEEKGSARAKLWYWMQILSSIPALVKSSLIWSVIMIKNYLKIAIRNLIRHKGFSFINLAGLAIGMASCILIFLWIQNEWSYDNFHSNRQDLYRVYTEIDYNTGQKELTTASYYPLRKVIEEECPGALKSVRFAVRHEQLLRNGENKFMDDTIGYADPDFFGMFTFPLLKGDPKTALSDPLSVILTQAASQKYFGSQDPMGKILTVNDQYEVFVTGIMKNLPRNSTLQFDLLCPFVTIFGPGNLEGTSWGGNPLETYVLLQKDTKVTNFESQMTTAALRQVGDVPPNMTIKLLLEPMEHMHLYALEGGGLITFITILSIIAVFILVIACINFMNLTTARANMRANEVGLRKVVGATKSNLIKQFLGESILMTFVALFIALVLVLLSFPLFNNIAGAELSVDLLLNSRSLWVILGIVLLTGLISGSYPAFFLSSFQPVKVLKGFFRSGLKNSFFRKVLVVSQFSISIFLIIGTLVIYRQMNYIQNANPGYARDQITYMMITDNLKNQFDAFRNELLKSSSISHVATSCQNPLWITSNVSKLDWEGKDPTLRLSMNWEYVDYDYIETMGMEMKEGRNFSQDFPSDLDTAFILNEEAVKLTGLKSPVGKRFSMFTTEGTIIGVVKNFHFESLYSKIKPLILSVKPSWSSYILVRIKPNEIPEALGHMKNVWKDFSPNRQFQNYFLSDMVQVQYLAEMRMGKIFNGFTVLAILISCLGIYGLASFMAEQRTKEIGIRKVLGANEKKIIFMLSQEFSKWVLFANLIAWPIAYFSAYKWIQHFAYRIGIEIWLFFLAAALAYIIAMLTVSLQSYRAARLDPVDSLRYE